MKDARPSPWTEEKLSRLRKKVHERGEEFIRRMMQQTEQGENPYDMNFTGRESLAERLGQQFGSMLLEENLIEDRWVQIVQEAVSWKCPRCGTDAPALKDPDGHDRYEEVEINSKVGTLALKLRQFSCGKCRKVFSPLPSAPPARPGEL